MSYSDSFLESEALLHHEDIPEWYQDNEYITKGYRIWGKSCCYYAKSIFTLHNETFNIWTHLIGSLLFIGIGINCYINDVIRGYWGDKVAMGVFLLTVIFCFTSSFVMHTFYPISESVTGKLMRLDYFGISLLILGSYGPFIYYAFYCQQQIQWAYYLVINVLGLTSIIFTCLPFFHRREFRIYRALTFGLFISSVICPIVHRIVLNPINQNDFTIEIEFYLLSLILYILGGIFYTTRFPENTYQNNCTLYFSSHKLFHCCTILGALSTYFGILKTHIASEKIICS